MAIYMWREYSWQPGANTVAYYPLDSTNTVNDLSGNSNTLTNNGASFGTYSGVDCAYLPKVSSRKLYTNIAGLTGNPTFTISVYVNRIDTIYNDGSQLFVIGAIGSSLKCIGTTIRTSNNQYRTWSWGAADVTSTATNTFNQREHIVITKDVSNVKIYKNGVQFGSGTLTTSITSTNFTIGSFDTPNNGNDYQNFVGYMSKFILEDKARTAQEVSDYYDRTKSLYGIS